MTNKNRIRGGATMGMLLVLLLPFTLPKCDGACYCCTNHDGEDFCDDSGGQLCEKVDSCSDGGCGGECDSTPDGLQLNFSALDPDTANALTAIAGGWEFKTFQMGEAVVEPITYEELSSLNTPARLEWINKRGLVPVRLTLGQLSTHVAIRLEVAGDSIHLKGWAPGADQELATLEAQQSLADYQTLTGSITTGIALLR